MANTNIPLGPGDFKTALQQCIVNRQCKAVAQFNEHRRVVSPASQLEHNAVLTELLDNDHWIRIRLHVFLLPCHLKEELQP